MKLNLLRLVAISTVLVSAVGGGSLLSACSGGGTNNDAGVDSGGGDTGTKKDSGVKDTGTVDDSGDDAGPTPFITPLCSAPSTPSNGSCVADAGFACNPITNSGCQTDAGEACDFTQNGFKCYGAPPPNTQALCATCDDQNTACLPGSTCVPVDSTGNNSQCAKFCCNDNDCTGGHCDNTTLSNGQATPFGFCVK